MTLQEVGADITRKLRPILEERGVEGFVLMAYVKLDEDQMARILVTLTNKNVAIEDGLRPAVRFAMVWAANEPPPFPSELPGEAPEGGR